jgi:small-conductance mechanosensitive channel
MNELLDKLGFPQYLKSELILDIIWAALTLTIGLILAWLISRGIARMLRRRLKAQELMLVKRLSYYLLFSLVIIATLHQLGIDLGLLLGAAGILSVAIGFASQTSASNIISGIFLIAERPFVVGDLLNVDGTIGEVVSIDLISVKIRTFDNLMLRVPNEMLIKSTFVNLTRFPIRRLDVQVGVAYKEDTEKVRRILFDVADRNPLCLDEPKPLFIYKGYGDSALELQFSVWAKRENFLFLRNSIHEEIKTAFDKNGIEIPFPHRTIYTGSVTEPFPVQVVEGGEKSRS